VRQRLFPSSMPAADPAAAHLVGISRQEGDGVRNLSLPLQESIEGRVLGRNDGARFRVVADALADGETDASSAEVCSRCNNRLEVRTRRLLRPEFGAFGVFERIGGRAWSAFSS